MDKIAASPSVRALARERNIDINELAEKLGRAAITRDDLDPSDKVAPTDSPNAPDKNNLWDVDHSRYGPISEAAVSRFSQISSTNLCASTRTIPQVTHHDSADISLIESFRKSLSEEGKARGIKLTTLAFQVKALATVLQEFKKFNASLSPDGKTLYVKDFVHIGIAIDTEYGLTVPVIRDADQRGIWDIAAQIKSLAARAKARKLAPDDMGGASMTISNLGGLGGSAFSPIVNPPEVAILGITKTEIRPVWSGEQFEPRPMLPMDLSYDHRVINGADAARFMTRLADTLSDPYLMMV